MIKVWTDHQEAGVLDRDSGRGSVFAYTQPPNSDRSVSLTMPARVASWNFPYGLAPIFEMNLPEGVLRERLRNSFAKAVGSFDELDLLSIVGRSQMGRIRYTGMNESLNEEVPFQSVDEILKQRRDGDLFEYLVKRFAVYSGVSGVQPKILIRDAGASAKLSRDGLRSSSSFRGATHIVKFWEPTEFPELAANEFFCLTVARRCGLTVPEFRLADDGKALVIDRFDITEEGEYLGFEDFCVLNGKRTDQKYMGSYETAILRRFTEFSADSPRYSDDLESLFTLIVLNCTLRNGDAHLKNFGVLYSDVQGPARLSPVYDIITTPVYLPNDQMALTLEGSTRWPTGKKLRTLGEARVGISSPRVAEIFELITDSVSDTEADLKYYLRHHNNFSDIGNTMVNIWSKGVAELGGRSLW